MAKRLTRDTRAKQPDATPGFRECAEAVASAPATVPDIVSPLPWLQPDAHLRDACGKNPVPAFPAASTSGRRRKKCALLRTRV